MVQRIRRQARNEPSIRRIQIVVRDTGEIMVQRVVAETHRRP